MRLVALNTFESSSEVENITIEYANSVGVLFLDSLLLYKYNSKIPIELNSIKKIMLIKKEYLIYNLIGFLIGVVAVISIFLIATTLLEIIFLSLLGLFFFSWIL